MDLHSCGERLSAHKLAFFSSHDFPIWKEILGNLACERRLTVASFHCSILPFPQNHFEFSLAIPRSFFEVSCLFLMPMHPFNNTGTPRPQFDRSLHGSQRRASHFFNSWANIIFLAYGDEQERREPQHLPGRAYQVQEARRRAAAAEAERERDAQEAREEAAAEEREREVRENAINDALFEAADDQLLRGRPEASLGGKTYVVYNGRKMGLFQTW